MTKHRGGGGGGGGTLWDKAVDESNQSEKDDSKTTCESSVVFVGSKNAGKTSIILRFLDRDELPKPTTALEYTFGRRAKGHNIAKDVGHIWELGGGIWLSKLLELPLSPEYVLRTSVIVVVDLSAPNEIWLTLDTLLTSIRKELEQISVMDPDLGARLKEMANEKIRDHNDKEMLNPIPLPMVIIGGKCDLFQEMEPEKRKIICKTLRFVAHHCGASLQFFSTRQESLMQKAKVAVSHLLFQTSPSQTLQIDHQKPLSIPFGQDSFEQIGSPPGRHDARTPYDLWKSAFLSYFPQDVRDDPAKADDPAKDSQYMETAVDNLRAQRAEELERYRKVCERRFQEAKQALQNEAY